MHFNELGSHRTRGISFNRLVATFLTYMARMNGDLLHCEHTHFYHVTNRYICFSHRIAPRVSCCILDFTTVVMYISLTIMSEVLTYLSSLSGMNRYDINNVRRLLPFTDCGPSTYLACQYQKNTRRPIASLCSFAAFGMPLK